MNRISRRTLLVSAGAALTSPLISSARNPLLSCDSEELHLADDAWLLLGSNENPYGPSPMARKAMSEAIIDGNRYPHVEPLIHKIAERHAISPDQVVVGAGSAEILGLAALLTANKGLGNIVSAKPTFFLFMDYARRCGLQHKEVPLDDKKAHNLAQISAAITSETKAVYICNPNNPTGTVIAYDLLKQFCIEHGKNTLVVLDEVYMDYINAPSLIPLTMELPNLIIVRSFSKLFGLAGMRVGYAVAHADTAKKLLQLQSWKGNAITQVSMAAALASLNDKDFQTLSRTKTSESREIVYNYLQKKNIPYALSVANVVYFSLERFPTDYIRQMESKKIMVREIQDYSSRWCRVSMGTPENMKVFCSALESLKI